MVLFMYYNNSIFYVIFPFIQLMFTLSTAKSGIMQIRENGLCERKYEASFSLPSYCIIFRFLFSSYGRHIHNQYSLHCMFL